MMPNRKHFSKDIVDPIPQSQPKPVNTNAK